jgi:eukaryotic-like serine/threonine-protein kinase
MASPLIGTTLDGAYRITRLIAEGGMSAVYEAVQLRLNQRVAVKVMARELASNQEALARFQREAEVTSRLRHPHLVTVTDFGTAPTGQPYLVMEYLEGIDLDQRLGQVGRLPLPTVVHITKQAASALAAAHEQGIVHRDLKPANVFLVKLPGEPDFAKILDFGISKVRAAGTQLTKTQAIIGTPNYMSPEQATGMLEEVDHRTDQWALACIVWEMLSGHATFASDDMSAVFYQVIHLDPRSLRGRVPDLPAAVEAVLRRALSKKATDRFPSIRDFANALASAAFERPARAALARARVAPDSSGERAARDGAAWVERRQARRERRRSDAPPSVAHAAGQTDGDDLTTVVRASLWRKVKPIHALSALTAALAVVALALLRWNPPAKAAAPSVVPPASVVMPASAAPPVVTPPAAEVPAVVASQPQPASLAHATTAPAVQAAPPKPAEAEALVRDALDPSESSRRAVKHRPAKAGRRVDDADDTDDAGDAGDAIGPLTPTRPSSKHKPPRARGADTDFIDPFAP